MEPSEKSSFEEAWSDAFANASIPPPKMAWDAIEKALDEEQRKKSVFAIFWQNKASVFRAAAGIALFGTLGWLGYDALQKPNELTVVAEKQQFPANNESADDEVNRKIGNNQSEINNTSKSSDLASVKTNQQQKNQNLIDKTEGDINNDTENSNLASVTSNEKQVIQNSINEINKFDLKNTIRNKDLNQKPTFDKTLARNTSSEKSTNPLQTIQNQTVDAGKEVVRSQVLENFKENTNLAVLATDVPESRFEIRASELQKKDNFKLPPNRLDRKLLIDYDFTEVAEVKQTRKNDTWFGLQTGMGSFNAGFEEKGLNRLAAESFSSSKSLQIPGVEASGTPNGPNTLVPKSPYNRSSARESFRTGIAVGKNFGKRFLIESGVQYFRGNSMLESNTYSYNTQNGVRNAFVVQQLNNSKAADFRLDNSVTEYASNTELSNRNEYVSVPVQFGLTLLNKRKLNFSLLGGASADVFVGNTIGGNSFQNLSSNRIDSQDGVYKPLNFSVLGSGRLNYKLQKRMIMYLGGQLQQGVGSALKANNELKLNLRQVGVQYGVNYKF